PEQAPVSGPGDVVELAPGRLMPATDLALVRVEQVAGRKDVDLPAPGLDGLQLGGNPEHAVVVAPVVERHDADRIARNQVAILCLVEEHEGENAVEAIQEFAAVPAVEGEDDLTVRAGLEIV